MATRRHPFTNRLLEYVFRPLAVVVFATLGVIYKLLFGWWLGPWMKHLGEKQLKEDVQQSVPSLFAEHAGEFAPNLQKYHRGSDAVTVLAEGIFFQIGRWRDEITVRVAPETNPTELQELVALAKRSDRFQSSQQPANFFTLRQFDKFLVAHFDAIRAEIQDRREQQRTS